MHDHGDRVRARQTRRLDAVGPGGSDLFGFMAREALAMSTVPLIMAAMPVPEPPPVTEMRTSG
jgi:hypothetical protein